VRVGGNGDVVREAVLCPGGCKPYLVDEEDGGLEPRHMQEDSDYSRQCDEKKPIDRKQQTSIASLNSNLTKRSPSPVHLESSVERMTCRKVQ
jgi:hypothetical protein